MGWFSSEFTIWTRKYICKADSNNQFSLIYLSLESCCLTEIGMTQQGSRNGRRAGLRVVDLNHSPRRYFFHMVSSKFNTFDGPCNAATTFISTAIDRSQYPLPQSRERACRCPRPKSMRSKAKHKARTYTKIVLIAVHSIGQLRVDVVCLKDSPAQVAGEDGVQPHTCAHRKGTRIR